MESFEIYLSKALISANENSGVYKRPIILNIDYKTDETIKLIDTLKLIISQQDLNEDKIFSLLQINITGNFTLIFITGKLPQKITIRNANITRFIVLKAVVDPKFDFHIYSSKINQLDILSSINSIEISRSFVGKLNITDGVLDENDNLSYNSLSDQLWFDKIELVANWIEKINLVDIRCSILSLNIFRFDISYISEVIPELRLTRCAV